MLAPPRPEHNNAITRSTKCQSFILLEVTRAADFPRVRIVGTAVVVLELVLTEASAETLDETEEPEVAEQQLIVLRGSSKSEATLELRMV